MDFNFRKTIENMIINDFKKYYMNTNLQKVTFSDCTRTNQFFTVSFVRNNSIYTIQGNVNIKGFIRFKNDTMLLVKSLS